MKTQTAEKIRNLNKALEDLKMLRRLKQDAVNALILKTADLGNEIDKIDTLTKTKAAELQAILDAENNKKTNKPERKVDLETPALKAYLAVVHEIFENHAKRFNNPDIVRAEVTAELGSRYIKVKNMGHIQAFIDRLNGDILKPATWRAPAKHARGNINDKDHGRHAVDNQGFVKYMV